MRIVFVGAGAVGGYFGGRMLQAGLDVSFFLRPDSAARLRSAGLRLTSPAGNFVRPGPRVIAAGEEAPTPDVLFIACKAENVRPAARLASYLVGESTVAIPLQNGVDAPADLCLVLPPGCVTGGLSRIFAERVSSGQIRHTGLAVPSITCGEIAGGRSERVGAVVEHLAAVEGMAIDESEDIWTEMWKKLLMVCSLGVVGAAARAPLGILLSVPETRELFESCAAEIEAVGRASGARIPKGYGVRQIARYEMLSPTTTASMHRDLERGNASELEGQLGAVLNRGRKAGVPTPLLAALYGALLPGELRARGKVSYKGVAPRSGA